MSTNFRVKLGIVCIILIAIVCIKYFRFSDILTISYFHQHLQLFKKIIQQRYFFAVTVYCSLYFLATILCIPGSSIFTIAGGMFFNKSFGILYALTSATAGATTLFLFSRYMIGKSVQKRYENQLRRFNHEMKLYGKYYLLTVRLVGLLPFGMVTMLSSVTILPLSQFILMTAVGILPVSIIYAYTGFKLAHMQTLDDFYSPSIMGASAFVVASKVLLLPLFIKFIHWRSKSHNQLV